MDTNIPGTRLLAQEKATILNLSFNTLLKSLSPKSFSFLSLPQRSTVFTLPKKDTPFHFTRLSLPIHFQYLTVVPIVFYLPLYESPYKIFLRHHRINYLVTPTSLHPQNVCRVFPQQYNIRPKRRGACL